FAGRRGRGPCGLSRWPAGAAQRGAELPVGRNAILAARLSGSRVVSRAITAPPSQRQVLTWLERVCDPEIPVLSVVDLGLIREVAWEDDTCVVTITPTY